ncbi:MAG: hypothetical protein NTX22_15815 [Ignavibacteriales bacterium]|nr:hypothetical protein [Ignavibacteriales bacterium]
MNNYQTNLYRMFLAVQSYLLAQAAITSKIPAFGRAITKLQNKVKEIEDIDSGKIKISSGKTGSKAELKKELAEHLSKVASALFTYADENKITELKARVDYSDWDLKKKKDTELVSVATAIHADALPLISSLADFGIMQDEIDLLADLTADFKDAIGESGSTKSKKSGATKALIVAFNEAKKILENEADKHVNTLKKEYPNFYNEYKTAREILNYGGSHPVAEEENKTDTPAETK